MNELFKIDTIISFKEYLKIKKFYKKTNQIIIFISILIILISILNFIKDFHIIFLIASISVFVIYLDFLIYLFLLLIYYYRYNKQKNELNYTIFFYENQMKRKGRKVEDIIKYEDIEKIKENKKELTLILKNNNIKILKSNDQKEIISFIKKIQKQNKNKIVQTNKMLNHLFITLICLFCIILLLNLSLIDNNTSNSYCYMWTMWLILPLSIFSIIIGLKYKDKSSKSIKNIIGGSLITFLALIYGLLSFIPNNEIDYQEIYQLEDIIGIELPKTGIYRKEEIKNSNLENHIVHELIFSKKNEYLKVEQEIEASNKWLDSDEVSRELSFFLPVVCRFSCSYSVYIDGAKTQNTIPKEKGTYHIYAMLYNDDNQVLRIDEYTYNYN